jgi:hypothetical protein
MALVDQMFAITEFLAGHKGALSEAFKRRIRTVTGIVTLAAATPSLAKLASPGVSPHKIADRTLPRLLGLGSQEELAVTKSNF